MAATVGYTGSADASPAMYASVCRGDGNTEAVRVTFDPVAVGYEEVVRRFVDDPRVFKRVRRSRPAVAATWVDLEGQREVALRVCPDMGKNVPVLDAAAWFDAEDSHPNFFGC